MKINLKKYKTELNEKIVVDAVELAADRERMKNGTFTAAVVLSVSVIMIIAGVWLDVHTAILTLLFVVVMYALFTLLVGLSTLGATKPRK